MDDRKTLSEMQKDWDDRARENAFYYVASGRDDWDAEAFYVSGRKAVREAVLNDAERLFQGREPATLKALEIGCGAGRMTRALSDVVGEVHAVDVSPEMLRRANEGLADRENVVLRRTDGAGLEGVEGSDFDFALSYIVFQHIPSQDAIEGYMRDVALRLRGGASSRCRRRGARWRSSGATTLGKAAMCR